METLNQKKMFNATLFLSDPSKKIEPFVEMKLVSVPKSGENVCLFRDGAEKVYVITSVFYTDGGLNVIVQYVDLLSNYSKEVRYTRKN